MKTGKVVLGVLAGIAAGALLGILFAPDKGSETRKKISKKGSDAVDDLKEKFDALMGQLNEKVEAAEEGAGNIYKKGGNKVEEIKKDIRAAIN